MSPGLLVGSTATPASIKPLRAAIFIRQLYSRAEFKGHQDPGYHVGLADGMAGLSTLLDQIAHLIPCCRRDSQSKTVEVR